MSHPQIERFWGKRCLVPALQAIGQSRQIAAREELAPHRESNVEIHLIMDGSVNWWVEDQVYQLPPDSIFVTQPQELHGGVKNMVHPSSLLWLQVRPELLSDQTLATQLTGLAQRQSSGAHKLTHFVNSMLAECRIPQADSPVVVRATLHLFLAHLLRQFSRVDATVAYPAPLQTMLALIEANVTQSLSVEDLCQHVNLSRSRIFQMFDQHIGQSPISYMSSLRIERAKQLLTDRDDSVTTIAQMLGYSSSQHFATAFRRVTGVTPSAYRRG